MKASTPVFIHSQYPAQVFFLPPGWLMLCVISSILLFIVLNFLLPSLSGIIAIVFACAFYIFIKIKMGKDRHSDEVWRMGLDWKRKHRTNRLTIGGERDVS